MNYHQSLINHETHESFSTTKLTKVFQPRNSRKGTKKVKPRIAQMGTDGDGTTKYTKVFQPRNSRKDTNHE